VATWTVRQGDVLAEIARRHGFTDESVIWNHPRNEPLRRAGRTPALLAPGDQLFVPDRAVRLLDRGTNARHTVKVRRQQLRLRLTLQRLGGVPLGGAACVVRFAGTEPTTLATDGSGALAIELAPGTTAGTLEIRSPGSRFDGTTIRLHIGHLDPVTTVTGQEARLNNLGYRAGASGERDDEDFRSAVEEFQCDTGLAVDGVCGPATQARLVTVHGS
jgi:hypothetical protein